MYLMLNTWRGACEKGEIKKVRTVAQLKKQSLPPKAGEKRTLISAALMPG